MVGDKELLNYLYENIDMGITALEALKKNLEGTDNKIKSNVLKSLEVYKDFFKRCNKMRKTYKVTPTKSGIIAKMMTEMGTNAEFKRDNSDSKIAETLIQGYNMGILNITKKMKAYKDDTSKEVMKLCKEYKEMMETGIKDIKGFL